MTQEPGNQRATDGKPREGEMQGQGDDLAGRRLRDARRSFAKQKPVAARKPSEAASESDPHVEENLDRGLEETFPASDPVSISPGAD